MPIGRIAATLTSRYVGKQRIAAPSQKRALFVTHDGRRMNDTHTERARRTTRPHFSGLNASGGLRLSMYG